MKWSFGADAKSSASSLRKIMSGTPSLEYRNNHISTQRYSWYAFLPVSLLFQFRKLSNLYFLASAAIMLIPEISPLTPFSAIGPLIFIVAVSELRMFLEELGAYRRDKKANEQRVDTLTNRVKTKDLRPGDLVLVRRDQQLPADLVLLLSSNSEGSCFVETANLDGETNLKLKRSPGLTSSLNLPDLYGYRLMYDAPTADMYLFKGVIESPVSTSPPQSEVLNINHLLLRGSTLRNTDWVAGVVVYSGNDAKMLLNARSGTMPSKSTCMDLQMNRNVLSLFGFQMVVCVVCATISFYWDVSRWWYLGSLTTPIWISTFLTYFILFNTIIPASLWVSVEILKYLQSFFLESDPVSSIRCNAKNTHEELGQITHVFSDKTGTLTVNKMKFVGCAVEGRMYLLHGDEALSSAHAARLPFPGVIPPSNSLVAALRDSVEILLSVESELFFALALCHTCERLESGNQSSSPDEAALVQMAAEVGVEFRGRPKPDEIGVEFENKLKTYKILHSVPFTSERRMMTVVVQRDGAGDRTSDVSDDTVFVIAKGADSSIFPKCSGGNVSEGKHVISTFSSHGYRTLCVGMKEMSVSDWLAIEKSLHASRSGEGVDSATGAANALIESNLKFVGCTAVEDRLQEGVPETLSALKAAGIKVCMITGDKQETAINIARSCGLISSRKNIFAMLSHAHLYGGGHFVPLTCLREIAGQNGNVQVGGQFGRAVWDLAMRGNPQGRGTSGSQMGSRVNSNLEDSISVGVASNMSKFSLVIDGDSLQSVLASAASAQHLLDVLLFDKCEAVVFCRVSPKQKGQIVGLVKGYLDTMGKRVGKQTSTLSIGDGANDVNMINVANIGVGIVGQEGSQAANSADYAINQFSDLYPLLFKHGRLNYMRTSTFINLFMYKNFLFTCCQIWFATMSAFTAQTVFDDAYVLTFNSVFCIIPLFLFGLLEKDIDIVEDGPGGTNNVQHTVSKAYWNEIVVPGLYKGIQRFSELNMFLWCFLGAAQSVILLYGSWLAWQYTNTTLDTAGRNANFWMTSILLYSQLVLVITIVNLAVAKDWNKWFLWSLFIFNIGVYFAFVFVYDLLNFGASDHVQGIAINTIGNAQFWLVATVNLAIAVCPIYVICKLMQYMYPKTWVSITQIVRMKRRPMRCGKPCEIGNTTPCR